MAGNESVIRETSFMELYQKFGDSTSMHGIGRILTNKSTCKRVVWAVMVLGVSGIAVFQFLTVVNDFYSYPVTTVVTLKYETEATFPGVTFCNINRKRKSLAWHLMEDDFANDTKTEGTPSDTHFNALIQFITLDEKIDSGHQLPDMLIKCLFNRQFCSLDNFSVVDTTNYGNCYYFETLDPLLTKVIFLYPTALPSALVTPAAINTSAFFSVHKLASFFAISPLNAQYSQYVRGYVNKNATRPGPQNGLILELNIEQYEYLPITSKAGVKVFIHPPDVPPFPEDGGILAQPGAATSFGVKKVLTRRLPRPYSTCVGANGEGSSQRNIYSNETYTQKTCSKSCYQMRLYEHCKCCDSDLPCDYHTLVNKDGGIATAYLIPVCNTTDSLDCQYAVEDRFLKDELDCEERCPPACDQTTYNTIVSTALWPSDSYIDTLLQITSSKVFYDATSNTSSIQFARSNFLRLEIFLDSFDFLEFVAQPKYDWGMLLGNVGGLLGLWLGFSLLTGMEIAEVLMDTVVLCIRRRYTKTATLPTE